MTSTGNYSLLTRSKIVAVLRATDAGQYPEVIAALVAGNVSTIELTMTTPGTLQAIGGLRDRFGDATTLGVGTVLSSEEAEKAITNGAQFIVSPSLVPDVVKTCGKYEVPVLPGVLTPSEIQQALALGADAVKIFPAQTVGSDYLRHLHGPFPGLQAIPSGGVDLDIAKQWIKSGAPTVSIGGPLLGNVFHSRDFASLTKRARDLTTELENL